MEVKSPSSDLLDEVFYHVVHLWTLAMFLWQDLCGSLVEDTSPENIEAIFGLVL